MHSRLIDGLPFQTFGLCVAIGILAATWLMERLSRRKDITNLVFLVALAGIAGARAAHVIEFWNDENFAANPLSILAFWRGGLVFYGGLIAGVAAFFGWCIAKRVSPLPIADLFGVALPLGHAFGRIGCFFHGCCWGKVSDSFLAVRFPAGSPVYAAHPAYPGAAHSLPVLPTQLFESAALFALFAALYFLYRRRRAFTWAAYMAGYGVIRFCMEFLRDDARPEWQGLSSAQLFSIAMIAAGAVLFAGTWRPHAAKGNTDSDRR